MLKLPIFVKSDLRLRTTSYLALFFGFACAHAAPGVTASSPPQSFNDAASDRVVDRSIVPQTQSALATSDVESTPAQSEPQSGSSGQPPPGPAVVGIASSAASAETSVGPIQPMMDIEANLAIEVRDVAASISQVRSLVVGSGGQILEESLQDARRQRPTANLTVRIPSRGAFDFLARIESTGVVRSRHLNSRDVGKEYFDALLRTRSLEQVLERYQQLLGKASSIDETLKIEEQIARVSGEIEKIKGELRWLKDRVARATIHIEIFAKGDWIEPVVTPEAKLYPGLRAAGSIDWRGDRATQYGLGAGLSLRFSRNFSVDFDGFQNTKAPHGALDLTLLTLGGEFYSDFLGAGRRHWLNPYLGLRGGYARIEGHDQFVVGGTVGVEIFKSEPVTLSLDTRFLEALGGSLGSHLVVVPALGANFAF